MIINLIRVNLGLFCKVLFCLVLEAGTSANPFLRPESKKPAPLPLVRQAPLPATKPFPRNTNLEFRGYFKYENEWNFAIFDKSKNQGVWLKKGESFDDGKIEVVDFDPQLHEVRLRGGMKLVLKDSDKRVLAVPSGQAVPKKNNSNPIPPPPPGARSIPQPRRR